ncbi:MAG: hypothetical protein K6C32_00590 [Bacilli bacterium]|nr:hypothetical protein [Bacilli bacterium]
MKKLFSIALGVLMAAGLAACGGTKFSDKVLSAGEGHSVHYAGAVTGGWTATDANAMEATSVAKVAEADKAVAKKLAKHKLDWLYIKEGLTYGVESGGWKANFKKDGKVYQADASYTVKAIWVDADEAQQWVSDPKTAHAEALNDNVFFPTWQEDADADGFAWDQNPVVTGGAGVYTLVVAKYTRTSTAKDAGYAMALIKTEDKEGIAYEKQFVFDHYRLVGSINSWNNNDTAAAVQFDKDNNQLEYTFAVDDQFKVIQADAEGNGTWTGDMGFAALDPASTAAASFADEGGNFKVVTAGTYVLKVVEGKVNISAK